MPTRLLLTASLSAAILTACATRQENPFYKYSANYPAETSQTVVSDQETPVSHESGYNVVIQADMEPGANIIQTATRDAKNPKTETPWTVKVIADPRLTQVDGKCLTNGAVVPCAPEDIPITQSYARISAPYESSDAAILASNNETEAAPTDSQYGGTLDGTPGYYAMQSSEADYVTIESNHLYADQTPSEGTTIAPALIEAGAPGAGSFANTYISSDGAMLHRVIAGDTVYSLARKTCSSVTDIQAINGLGNDFGIRQGDTIRLPASRC